MSEEKRSFSRIQVRLKAQARIMQSVDSPQLFTGDATAHVVAREELFQKSKLPEELTSFLIEMDRKLDQVIGLLSQDYVKTDFSYDFEVKEISAAGLKFRSDQQFQAGTPLEIVLFLSHSPLHMAGSKGRILDKESDTGLYRFEFVDMRGSDMEAIVQFVFKEQREQIRNSKM
ncbi:MULTISPECIES: PilZ domain-containing protein [unclassified Pseudodesulfovibrio]|uniref:PilZ domain-containing protein n=1 Tax=unclassified Pseudodesulfovibrio TaxID=2661612 RepID=UPI000FEBE423|nr:MULTISPECIES: PilZ domain-containing protein [unclassified Pseudodesulfovibrio]MCJ2163774.1 PilZ domain-containing protein [Pseudodesulfovibrio sp. S3-i]RWU05977.1 PilZ domain-containing protein [Pseudodesulfovibrio sp. S3]